MKFNIFNSDLGTKAFSEEVAVAQRFSLMEFATTIKALSILLNVGVEISPATALVKLITPNAKLRRTINFLIEAHWSAGMMFWAGRRSNDDGDIDYSFYLAFEYGELEKCLGEMLLDYACRRGVLPHALADQIGWGQGMRDFYKLITDGMAEENSGILAYRQQPCRFLDVVALIQRPLNGKKFFVDKIRAGKSISDAFVETGLFDPFSLAVIKAAEQADMQAQTNGKESTMLCKAFQLLAEA